MSGIDVEALLESTAKPDPPASVAGSSHADDIHRDERQERRPRDRDYDRDRNRDRNREGDRDRRRRDRQPDGDADIDDRASFTGSRSSRRRSRSRDSDRRSSYRRRGDSRSRSPHGDDRRYRPSGRGRRDRDRDSYSRRNGRHSPSSRRSLSPPPNEDERDRRTIFVQQLSVRLRTKELIQFFEKVGPVKEAQIVKDRVSNRSKGVGYVEFKSEESVPLALQLTGQKLLGIPIIAQLTEAEKNRQARNVDSQPNAQRTSGPQLFHRLYVGNIHFNITEDDLRTIFEPFGELEFVQLQKEESGRSKGYGFVQFTDPAAAKEALEKMNGFDLAGRPIRVGLGNDKAGHNNTQRNGLSQSTNGATDSPGTTNGSSHFDRIGGGRDSNMAAGGASALDDSDIVGVNFNTFSRDALMRKLARVDGPAESAGTGATAASSKTSVLPIDVPQASRCIIVKNMFDPSEETDDSWVKDLEADVRDECQQKYGDVVSVIVDPSTDGDVYIKFKTVKAGENALKGLNGRYFAGKQITAQPVVDAVFSLFSRTKCD